MNITRNRFLKGSAALALAAVVGCAQEDGSKKFTVGFDADFPPYGYKEGSEYKGFDLDLAREVCSRKGWKFVANPINWDTKDMELNSGSIDCIWNGFTILDREDDYTWTVPYIGNKQVVLVKLDSPIRTLKDLAGRIVGVQTDTPVQKALQGKTKKPMAAVAALGKTFKDIVVMPNYNQAVNELSMGGVEAVAMDIGVAKKKIADLPGKFRYLDEIVMTETYGIGFKKGNVALKDEVEAELRRIFADGTAAKIAARYEIERQSLLLK